MLNYFHSITVLLLLSFKHSVEVISSLQITKSTFYQKHKWFIWKNITFTMNCHISKRSKVVYEKRNMLSGYANSKVIPFLPSIRHQNIFAYNSFVWWARLLLCEHQSNSPWNFQELTPCILVFNNNNDKNYPIHRSFFPNLMLIFSFH